MPPKSKGGAKGGKGGKTAEGSKSKDDATSKDKKGGTAVKVLLCYTRIGV